MLKRSFDIFVSFFALIFLSPVILWTSHKIAKNLGKPIFFKQKRPGLNGELFEMVKFRSMLDVKDKNGKILPDNQRLPPFGIWLRSTSLDEFPELLHVLKGDMSLVGPRPLLVEYLPLYNNHQARRHEVRPGITGWAQINGRCDVSWDEKFNLDIWYVENQTIWLDIKILFLTVKKVLDRDGISSNDHVTTEKFKGNFS